MSPKRRATAGKKSPPSPGKSTRNRTGAPPRAETTGTPPKEKLSSPFQVWAELARALPDGKRASRVPFPVLLDEAVDLARFFRTYYPTVRSDDGAVIRHGLDSVAGPARKLTATSGDELLSLRVALQEAQSRYLLSLRPRDTAHVTRARELLRELRTVLRYSLDGQLKDERDAQVKSVSSDPSNRHRSEWALAQSLHMHAEVAALYRSELSGLGGFDAGLIDEAFDLVKRLVSYDPEPPRPEASSDDALRLKNKMITLLSDRMAAIRGAARFVFRGSPAIVREATSPYERRRRSAARTASSEKKKKIGQRSEPETDA